MDADNRQAQAWATRLISLALNIIIHRILSLSWYMYEFPGVFALVLSDEDADGHRGDRDFQDGVVAIQDGHA